MHGVTTLSPFVVFAYPYADLILLVGGYVRVLRLTSVFFVPINIRNACIQIEVQLRNVNDFIVCKLCAGYFVNATTIMECLHTCKSIPAKLLFRKRHASAYANLSLVLLCCS